MGDLGCGGVQINGYGVGTTDVNHHNTVMYNNIHDTGRAPYLHSPAVSVFGSGYNTLTYNYITNVPYTAFSIMGTDHNSMSASTPDTRASYDTFGDKHRQYNIRWDELGGKDFGRWDCKEYQHSVNNVVEYNIIEEYMTDMNDGGCLYAWYPGLGNSFSFNVMHKSVKGRHMLWPLYMDDYTDGATVEGNRIWAIDQAELNKGDNPYIDNQYGWPDKPAGYDELYQSIMNQAEEAVGGFKTAPLGVPVLSSPENNAKDLAPVVDFSWNASENAAKYQLEIASDAEFTDILVSQETTKTRIDDVELDYGKTYYWRVSALGQAGANSQSEIFVITTKEETVPEAPTEIKLENDYDAVMISWEEGYHYTYTVYRREAGTDTFEKIAENIDSASYLDENVAAEKTYEYKVSASNQKGEGEASEPVAVTTRKVEVLFEDNFDNGASELWVSPQGGEVKTENGVMKYDGSWQEFFVNNDTADWSDYAFEADITITGYQDGAEEYSAIGLVSRTGLNPRQFNQLAMRKSGIVEAVMGKGNNWTTFATGSPFVVETGKTYHCRVEHLGNRVRYFIDSELIYEFETDQMRATGGIGIGFGRGYAEVDNVRVVAAVPAADKTALENAIAEAAQYEETDYTKASWAVFADALEKANEVNDNAEATQEEVDAAVKALNDAIAGLEEYVAPNKTLLQKTYDYALTLSTEGVTDSAKAYFEKAVAEAKAVLDDAKATQEEVNTAWDNLLDGIWGLGLVQGDKTLLEQLIAKAEAMIPNQDKYVQDNWQLLVDALAEAKKVMADGDAMEEDVQPAAEALLNAILAQRFKADKSILEELVNKAEGMDLSGYTAESVAVFRAALYNANLVLADETLSENNQAVVDEAVTELKNAIENLSADTGKPDTDDGKGDNNASKPDNGTSGNETSSNSPTDENNNSQIPETGDSNTDLLLMFTGLMFGFAVVFVFRRKYTEG